MPHETVGVYLDGVPARQQVIEACARAGKRVVDVREMPKIVITADGVIENGMVRPLKEEVDEALPDAGRVFVLRHLGNVPLSPTYDVYLDVPMKPGRDIWLDQVGASG